MYIAVLQSVLSALYTICRLGQVDMVLIVEITFSIANLIIMSSYSIFSEEILQYCFQIRKKEKHTFDCLSFKMKNEIAILNVITDYFSVIALK